MVVPPLVPLFILLWLLLSNHSPCGYCCVNSVLLIGLSQTLWCQWLTPVCEACTTNWFISVTVVPMAHLCACSCESCCYGFLVSLTPLCQHALIWCAISIPMASQCTALASHYTQEVALSCCPMALSCCPVAYILQPGPLIRAQGSYF